MYSYIILITVYLAAIAAPLNQFKVPPLLSVLRHELNMDLSHAGLLMSVFAIVGVFLSLPSGFIMRRVGMKITLLTALTCLLVGSFFGGISCTSSAMLASRIIEGIGMCFVSVVAPAAIAIWFPEHKRGIPMGVWSTWVPLGSIIMLLAAPIINNHGGWQSVWWTTVVYTAVVFAIVAVLFKMPVSEKTEQHEEQSSFYSDCMNRDIWLLSAVFLLYNILVMALGTFYPAYLEAEHHYSYEKASAIASLLLAVCLVVGPLTGVLLHRLWSYKKVLFFGMLMSTFSSLIPFLVPSYLTAVAAVFHGALAAIVPTAVFSSVAYIMKKGSSAGTGMAVLAFGQYTGMTIGPYFFGSMAEYYGWMTAAWSLIPVMALGTILVLFIRLR